MPIKWRIYIILVVLGGLAIVSRQRYYAGKWRRFEDEDAKFTLAYPATWYNVGPGKLPTQKYIRLRIMDFPVIDTIELRVYCINENDRELWVNERDFGEWLIRKNSKNAHILKRNDISVGKGYLGKESIYEDKTYIGRIVTTQYREQFYAIEINATKKKWDETDMVFDKILETFEFLD
jgi:hypothetical protein